MFWLQMNPTRSYEAEIIQTWKLEMQLDSCSTSIFEFIKVPADVDVFMCTERSWSQFTCTFEGLVNTLCMQFTKTLLEMQRYHVDWCKGVGFQLVLDFLKQLIREEDLFGEQTVLCGGLTRLEQVWSSDELELCTRGSLPDTARNETDCRLDLWRWFQENAPIYPKYSWIWWLCGPRVIRQVKTWRRCDIQTVNCRTTSLRRPHIPETTAYRDNLEVSRCKLCCAIR